LNARPRDAALKTGRSLDGSQENTFTTGVLLVVVSALALSLFLPWGYEDGTTIGSSTPGLRLFVVAIFSGALLTLYGRMPLGIRAWSSSEEGAERSGHSVVGPHRPPDAGSGAFGCARADQFSGHRHVRSRNVDRGLGHDTWFC